MSEEDINMPRAARPTRTYGKAVMSLPGGMTTFPVEAYSAINKDHGISRGQFVDVPVMEDVPDPNDPTKTVSKQKEVEVEQADGTKVMVPVIESHPVGNKNYDKVTGEEVRFGEIKRKISTEYGHVYVEDHEIETLFSLSPDTIKVLEFQPQHLFSMGHYVPKALLYLAPGRVEVKKKKVVQQPTMEAYSVFLAAMRARGLMAIVEFTNRGVPKPGILLPNGNLWLIYHTEEVREGLDVPLIEVSKEIAEQAAKVFLDPFVSTSVRDITDNRTTLIQEYADKKAEAGNFGQDVEVEAPTAPAVDGSGFMAMLQAQVDAAKAAQAV